MRNSIKAQLMWGISALLFITALLNAGYNFSDIWRETNELQDRVLRQVADYIDPNKAYPKQNSDHNDTQLLVQTSKSPDAIFDVTGKHEDFYDAEYRGDMYRFYLKRKPDGYVLVAQNSNYRTDLAMDVALDNLVPFAILLPLTVLAIGFLVHFKMRTVQHIAQEIEQRQDLDLTPIDTLQVPTEIQGFTNAINQLLVRTFHSIEQQQRFIADATHEMRSPMTALSLQAERLSGQGLPIQQAVQIEQIQQSIKRNRHLIEQLLLLAKAQASYVSLQKTEINSQYLFRQIIESLLPISQQKDQDIGVVGSQAVVFYAPEIDMFTLVKTLVDNALRYTPAESQIDLSCEEHDEFVIFSVEDNGNGIPSEMQERVLEPFFRILGTEQQGTGLGLAIAVNIAKRYGGYLELHDSQKFSTGLLVKVFLRKSYLQA
ncbi:ATP-binding protein [Actinobacillus arthritidis]|uniref:ATP-binding protein n=1 Tax=Actinobacillus arthritidis TaxID=157339 RepID=UPI00244234AA|nr:ATP-binding protein [Actinobacillus arthritidis]WGE88680.1 ATP-binding protein [Actinobacillus arthritidis]